MKIYQLRRSQFLPISRKIAWDFFSSPKNLALITPKEMNFEILSISGGDKMFAGQVIRYKVNVLPFVRTRWVTEITDVEEPEYFIDQQRSGPYTLWRHKHHFKETTGGIEMTDEVEYAMPFGWLGRLTHVAFVEREVKRIFDHRFSILETYFRSPD